MNKKNILIVSILILIIVAALIVWRYLPVIKNLIEKPVAKETQEREACKNLCGDGICQEFVCEAVGCPCAETKDNCLQDCNKEQEKNKEEACIAAGGKVAKNSCCKAVADFPNLCLIGACGCSPANSKEIKVCDCGAGKCFNGKECVGQEKGSLDETPISSEVVTSRQDPLEKTVYYYIRNRFDFPVAIELTQPLPSNAKVLSFSQNGGLATENAVVWQHALPLNEKITFSLNLKYSDSNIKIPSARLLIYYQNFDKALEYQVPER